MKINSTISFTLIALFLMLGAGAMATFSEPTSTPSGNNATTAIDTSSVNQTSPNTLGLTELLSGDVNSTMIAIDTVGRMGINKSYPAKPDVDVEVSVTGSIRSDLLMGTGVAPVCLTAGTLNSFVITRC